MNYINNKNTNTKIVLIVILNYYLALQWTIYWCALVIILILVANWNNAWTT